jgi:hypothetical protein
LVTEAPIPKDVVFSLFGASAGVAGLVLVFLGVVISTVGTYPGATSDAVLRPYRRAAWAAVAIFGGSLAVVIVSLAWLVITHSHWLYVLAIALFSAVLVALFALAAGVTKEAV